MTMTRDKVVLFRNCHSYSHCHCFLSKKSNAYRIATMKILYQFKNHYTSKVGNIRRFLDIFFMIK